ncbi:MAG: hypothetical protein ACTSWD_13620 [Candidatus Heimdallarchaeota archaeon]
MSKAQLISRIAADKSNKRIGRIIRIDDLPAEGSKDLTPHLIILVSKFLKKDRIVPIVVSKVIKTEDNYVWLDITTEEFEELLESAKENKNYKDDLLPKKELKTGKGPYLAGRR